MKKGIDFHVFGGVTPDRKTEDVVSDVARLYSLGFESLDLSISMKKMIKSTRFGWILFYSKSSDTVTKVKPLSSSAGIITRSASGVLLFLAT